MFSVAMSAVLLVAVSSGPVHCGQHEVRGECSSCRDRSPEVAREIARLQSAGWMARRKAARALRTYDWKSNPEAAEALAEALAHDDCGLVRQEAAESLWKLRPCLPVVHEAVARAARCEPSLLARHWAKKALKALAKGCVEECSVCETAEPEQKDVRRLDSGPSVRAGAAGPRLIVPEPEEPFGTSPFPFPDSSAPPALDPIPPAPPPPANTEAPPLESPALP
jgi:hypothetical protein